MPGTVMNAIDPARLMQRIDELSRYGSTSEGGVWRSAFGVDDIDARRVVAARMVEAGLQIRSDAVGNTIGIIPGRDANLPSIVIGSHTDSVPNGGKFDGVLGVVTGIECARVLRESGVLRHPLEVVNFVNEEQGLVGSRAWNGQVSPVELTHDVTDAMRRLGGEPERLQAAKRDPSSLRAYIELHIEQGPRLERDGQPVGIVTGIVGAKRVRITIEGKAAHAGATPMNQRCDALLAASRLTVAIHERTREIDGDQVATVGHMTVEPNATNVIAGRVTMTVDLRDINQNTIRTLQSQFHKEADVISTQCGVTVRFEDHDVIPPVECDARIVDCVGRAARSFGLNPPYLVSHAAHDASLIGQMIPTGMIFVRSIGGISHSPAEATSEEDCLLGASVLLQTLQLIDTTDW